jgi:cytoskeletal protein RodZ
MKKKMTTIFIVIAALALLVIAGGCASSQVSEGEQEETVSQVGESEPEETVSEVSEDEPEETVSEVSEDEPEETVSQVSESEPDQTVSGESEDGGLENGTVSSSEPLVAMVGSEEEAQELADACGITLISYQYGIATFDTAEDPEEVVKRSAEKGYPQLELNYEVDMMSID